MAGYLLLYEPEKMAREKVVDNFHDSQKRERERETSTAIHILWIPKFKRIYLKNQSLVISNLSRERF